MKKVPESKNAMERWLRDEVAPAYDAMKADPSSGTPASEVFRKLRQHHANRGTDDPVKHLNE